MKVSTQLWSALFLVALQRLELQAADPNYDGSGGILGNLIHTSKSQSRSICPENFTGEKGKRARPRMALVQMLRGIWGRGGKFRRRSSSKPRARSRWARSKDPEAFILMRRRPP